MILKFICIVDVSASVGLTLMKWVYTDQAEIPNDEGFLIELVKAAKKFRLKELKERFVLATKHNGSCFYYTVVRMFSLSQ